MAKFRGGGMNRTLQWLLQAGLALAIGTAWVASRSGPARAQSAEAFQWYRGRSTIALVFLHGLDGCAVPNGQTPEQACPPGAADSFRNSVTHSSWPDIIHDDDYPLARAALRQALTQPLKLSDLGIWGVNYSHLTGSGCPNFSIPNVANTVRKSLETSELFHRYEQVILVAHSMGGLIAKDMMVRWRATDNVDASYLPHIVGLMLLGVPSHGSPVASEPSSWRYVVQTLVGNRLAETCPRQVRDLFAGQENTYLNPTSTPENKINR